MGTYFLLVQKVGKDTLRGCPAPVALRAPGGPPPKDPLYGGRPIRKAGEAFRRAVLATRGALLVLPPVSGH